MGLFFDQNGERRGILESAGAIFVLPFAVIGLIPALFLNRGRLSKEQADSVLELLPSLFWFAVVLTVIMSVCFGAVFAVIAAFAS